MILSECETKCPKCPKMCTLKETERSFIYDCFHCGYKIEELKNDL